MEALIAVIMVVLTATAFFCGRAVGKSNGVIEGLDDALEIIQESIEEETEMIFMKNVDEYEAKHVAESETKEVVMSADVPEHEFLMEKVKQLEKEKQMLEKKNADLEKNYKLLAGAARGKVERLEKKIASLEKTVAAVTAAAVAAKEELFAN